MFLRSALLSFANSIYDTIAQESTLTNVRHWLPSLACMGFWLCTAHTFAALFMTLRVY